MSVLIVSLHLGLEHALVSRFKMLGECLEHIFLAEAMVLQILVCVFLNFIC